ncbi:hypothetical protein [Alkalibacillus haloalkaliphilus]|uniref:hypothetical protein n=1 Tax=Alkalibacillus haloalkaliphilus TaxID=94136 RepID=UPI0029366FAF|nr:hypothetical protein [Alkalibacillus haloalkaliphilus]MDV2582770.1 hypothetical protein [Alkalibacillus haloalkaliphilus]
MGEVELLRLVLLLFVVVSGLLIARFYDKWWATPIVTVSLYFGVSVFYQLFVPGTVRFLGFEAVIFLTIISVVLDVALDRFWKYKLYPIALIIILVFLGSTLIYLEQSKHTTMEQLMAEEVGDDFEIDRLDIRKPLQQESVSIDDEDVLDEWKASLNELELKSQEGWPRVSYLLEFYIDGNRHSMELDEHGSIYVDGQNYYIFNDEEVIDLVKDDSLDWSED